MAASSPGNVDPCSDLAIRIAAQDAVTRAFVCADRRDWQGLRGVLADTVALDYTSLTGGEPADISREDLLTAWRGTLGGFEATQHLLGSFVVDSVSPEQVRMRFYAIATHVLHRGYGDSTWTVAGHYDATLRQEDGWRLAGLTLHVDWAAGNQQLAALATSAP
jgi:SnoaL-like domain